MAGYRLQFGAYFTPQCGQTTAVAIAATLDTVPVGTILHTETSVWVRGTDAWK